jgi:hypothetical protein
MKSHIGVNEFDGNGMMMDITTHPQQQNRSMVVWSLNHGTSLLFVVHVGSRNGPKSQISANKCFGNGVILQLIQSKGMVSNTLTNMYAVDTQSISGGLEPQPWHLPKICSPV